MSAESMANPLRNAQIGKLEVLARESLQNSFDERLKKSGDPIIFKCKRHVLVGEQKRKFIEVLNLNELKSKSELFPRALDWFEDGHKAFRALNDLETPFPVLEVSDYNANGLGGRWNRGQSIEDRFFNLVLSINKTKKQDEAADTLALGSFGVGKMVFALCSNIRTMVYYSRFTPEERTSGAYARFMATAFLPSFEHQGEDKDYSGHAYFGIDSGEPQNPRKPFENEPANDLIQALGFDKRGPTELGTTVLLPACDIEIPELSKAIEKWWWPLLSSAETCDLIQIHLEDEFGNRHDPKPGRRVDLRPFVHCWNNKQLGINDERHSTQEFTINHEKASKKPGLLTMANLPEKHQPSELDNHVAFVRGGLVIQYNSTSFREEGARAVGVFKSSDKYKDYFVYSEPEAHDRWNEHSDRLRTFLGESGCKFIEQTKNQIKNKCRDFQLAQEKIQKPVLKDTLSFLDEILGKLIKPRKEGPPIPPEPSRRLPYIRKQVKRNVTGASALETIKFSIGLNNEEGVTEINYNLALSVQPLEDSRGTPGPRIFFDLSLDGGQEIKSNKDTPIKVTLKAGEELSGTASAVVHPSWTTKWTIALDPQRGGESDD